MPTKKKTLLSELDYFSHKVLEGPGKHSGNYWKLFYVITLNDQIMNTNESLFWTTAPL